MQNRTGISRNTGRLSASVKTVHGHWQLLQSCSPGCRFVSAHADPKWTQTWVRTPAELTGHPSFLLCRLFGSHVAPACQFMPIRRRHQSDSVYSMDTGREGTHEKGFSSSWPCSSPPGSSTGPSPGEAETSKSCPIPPAHCSTSNDQETLPGQSKSSRLPPPWQPTQTILELSGPLHDSV